MRSSEKRRQDHSELSSGGGYQIKTYRPTLEEMKDFSAYIKYIHEDGGHRAGLAKVIPPWDYKARKEGYNDEALFSSYIMEPIEQQVNRIQPGIYEQINLQKKKKIKVRDFKRDAETKHSTPLYNTPDDLERTFWKNIFLNPSIYGADVPGTLFDPDVEEFNLTKLNTILDDIRRDYGCTIQGVNTTYLYYGMWKTAFSWHTEDMDLYSINYLHCGAPKSWYCIAPEHGKRFERLADGFFPHKVKECKAFLRHKGTLISPSTLKKFSIPFSKITQEKGEFMITFPYSYHSGYNHGFNIAEATNFATEYWIEFGKWASKCECNPESVKISMQAFVKRYQPDRYDNWIRGRDVCKDPKDHKHVAAAPKPSDIDLFVRGNHEIPEGDETDVETSTTPIEKSKTKAKKNYPTLKETFKRYEEIFLNQHKNNQSLLQSNQQTNRNHQQPQQQQSTQNDHHTKNTTAITSISTSLPSYIPVKTNMVPISGLDLEPSQQVDLIRKIMSPQSNQQYDLILQQAMMASPPPEYKSSYNAMAQPVKNSNDEKPVEDESRSPVSSEEEEDEDNQRHQDETVTDKVERKEEIVLFEGDQVVAEHADSYWYDAQVERCKRIELFEVYYPSLNETETDIDSKYICDYDPHKTYRLGERLDVKSNDGPTLHAKFKGSRRLTVCTVRFADNTIAKRKYGETLYLNIDDMPEELLLENKYRESFNSKRAKLEEQHQQHQQETGLQSGLSNV